MSNVRRLIAAGLLLTTIVAAETAANPPASKKRIRPAAGKSPDDSGLRCLLLLCRDAGVKATLPELKRLCKADRPTLNDLQRVGLAKGLNLAVTRVTDTSLERQRGSGIAWTGPSGYLAFGPAAGNQAWLEGPSTPKRRKVSYAEVVGRSQGLVLLVKSRLNRID